MSLQDLAGLCPFVRESQVVRPNGHNSELGERIFNARNHVDIIVETIAIATIPKRMQKLYIRLHLHSIVPRQTILPSIRHDKRCKGIQQPALSSGHYSKFSHTASKMHNEKQQGTVFIRFPRCLVFCSVSIRIVCWISGFLSRCFLLTICIFGIYCSTLFWKRKALHPTSRFVVCLPPRWKVKATNRQLHYKQERSLFEKGLSA